MSAWSIDDRIEMESLLRRGLYLVSVMLNAERILVTTEDVLPMVEVDENYGHNLLGDFQWFMKLSFVWDDLKTLRPDLERCSSATTFYLRMKLVQAAIELQVGVGRGRAVTCSPVCHVDIRRDHQSRSPPSHLHS